MSRVMQPATVVIPARDEAEAIGEVVAALSVDYPVLVVDDSSGDRTAEAAAAAGAEVIAGPEGRRGYTSAVLAGIEAALAHGAVDILTVDGDGAHDPADARPLLEAHQASGAALTIGDRFGWAADDELPTAKRWANFLASRLIARATGIELEDVACGLRVYCADFAERLLSEGATSGYGLPYESIAIAGEAALAVKSHPVRVRYDAREPMTTRHAEIEALLHVASHHAPPGLDPRLRELRAAVDAQRPFGVRIGGRALFAHPLGTAGWLWQAQHRAIARESALIDLDAGWRPTRLPARAPAHVGVIPDGTRRWARGHGMKLEHAYALAFEQLEHVVDHLFRRGAEAVSLYLLSRLNLARSQSDLDAVFAAETVFCKQIDQVCSTHDARVAVAGDPASVPDSFQRVLTRLVDGTAANTTRRLYLCVAYEPYEELERAFSRAGGAFARSCLDVPEPLNLVIRTGSAKTLSNFLPLQAGYAQLHLLAPLWNELTTADLDRSLEHCMVVEKRFGN